MPKRLRFWLHVQVWGNVSWKICRNVITENTSPDTSVENEWNGLAVQRKFPVKSFCYRLRKRWRTKKRNRKRERGRERDSRNTKVLFELRTEKETTNLMKHNLVAESEIGIIENEKALHLSLSFLQRYAPFLQFKSTLDFEYTNESLVYSKLRVLSIVVLLSHRILGWIPWKP